MKVLMLSIDEAIMRPGSDAAKRMKEYGALVDELHIVIYTRPGFLVGKITANIFVYPTNTRWKVLYYWQARALSRGIFRDAKFAKENSMITSQDAFTNVVALRLRHHSGIPFQVQVHTDFMSSFFSRESWKNYLRFHLYAFSVKKADCVRVVSQHLKEELIRRFKISESKISILPIYVDVQKIREATVTTDIRNKYVGYDFIILMASRVTREKNIAMACRVVQELAKKFPRTLLLVVGDGPEKIRLSELFESKDDTKEFQFDEFNQRQFFAPPIRFEDAVSYNDLISYYKTADVFLLTSDYEGYGRTIVEAMAASTPVISTDVGVAREQIKNGETGYIFPAGDETRLKSTLERILLERQTVRMMKIKINDAVKTGSVFSKEDYLTAFRVSLQQCGR